MVLGHGKTQKKLIPKAFRACNLSKSKMAAKMNKKSLKVVLKENQAT